MDLDAVTAPACTICHRGLYSDEFGRYACRACQQRVDGTLAAIAGQPRYEDGKLAGGFYAALFGPLEPVPRDSLGMRVSGSRTPGLPIDVGLVDLQARGGLLAVLQGWVVDWASYGHAHLDTSGSRLQQADAAVKTLRFNLEWAASKHLAFDEFAREIREVKGACEARVRTEPPPARRSVACGACGHLLRVGLDMEGIRCSRCQAEYGREAMFELRPTRRAAA